MNSKKALGLIVAVIGVGLIFVSNYVQIQVDEGKVKIRRAERQVGQGQGLLSLDPLTKQFGNAITRGAERKIDEGKQEVEKYEVIAGRLQIAGIILIAGGILLFFFGHKKRVL